MVGSLRKHILMTLHYPVDGDSSFDWWKQISRAARLVTNQKLSPDLGSDTSSVWNFSALSSDGLFAGKPVVAVYSGYIVVEKIMYQ